MHWFENYFHYIETKFNGLNLNELALKLYFGVFNILFDHFHFQFYDSDWLAKKL